MKKITHCTCVCHSGETVQFHPGCQSCTPHNENCRFPYDCLNALPDVKEEK